ncbi:hypothetical protein Jab_1c18750 [Janthinobacterium sp. HH01]|uniref:hypothetical protein n=1 Tax=Janthinobacterium sp. HH01 TaxID=1198452 RepID=UPI0002AECCC8|nr:hypothetical protein [Janthinobacterium sp. HH01]ELX13253.1 hypothetical protein Jab_1c18750 [Janthinobacterium sp. HH01]
MKISRTWPHLIVAALLPITAHSANVDVDIKLVSADALEVSFALPEHCTALAFLKDERGGQEIRAAWQKQNDCATAEGDLLKSAGACTARFRVPATMQKISGYPGSFPAPGGMYVHSSNYALADSCGPVRYRFQAADIVMNGQRYHDAATPPAATGGDTSAMLMLTRQTSATLDYFDPRLSAATVARVNEVADGTIAFLRKQLPLAVFTRPAIAAIGASEPGGPNVGGDASNILRLTLFNWPQTLGQEEQELLTAFVSHEFSHRFQLRDAVDVYPDSRLINEGGAEFLRWLTSIQKGWLSRQQAAAQLDKALAECTLYTEGKSWRALTPSQIGSQRLEYLCGLPAYVYSLAARQGHGTAMSRFDRFYHQLRQGQVPDFAQALECGDTAACKPQVLPALLSSGPTMEQQWSEVLSKTGLATLRPPSQSLRDRMVLRAVVKLMVDDCAGRSGTTETPEGIILDGMKVCKSIHKDSYATSIEGHPVFGDAATGPAMKAACLARHEVTLGLKDGGKLVVPCQEPYAMREAFYAVDIEKALAQLLREQGAQ